MNPKVSRLLRSAAKVAKMYSMYAPPEEIDRELKRIGRLVQKMHEEINEQESVV